MARARRRQTAAVIDRLFDDPRRFNFFQAVRVLERQAACDARDRRFRIRRPVGMDFSPRDEAVRFKVEPHLAFPATQLTHAERGTDDRPAVLMATFMGLVGPMGVLPQHYAELTVTQNRQRSTALGQFLDLVHHRALSLFYRAWLKYRLPMVFERTENRLELAEHDRDGIDTLPPGTHPGVALFAALTGFGTDHLRGRLAFSDHLVWHYAGLLSATQRSVAGLEAMLSAVLARPVKVESFVGSWLAIAPDSQTRTPSAQQPLGQYCRLGLDTMAGARSWDAQGRFRLLLGPLDYPSFLAFMPGEPLLALLSDLVRLYVGPEFDVDLQVKLAAPDVPQIRMPEGDMTSDAPRLGLNTWMLSAPSAVERDDALFRLGAFEDNSV